MIRATTELLLWGVPIIVLLELVGFPWKLFFWIAAIVVLAYVSLVVVSRFSGRNDSDVPDTLGSFRGIVDSVPTRRWRATRHRELPNGGREAIAYDIWSRDGSKGPFRAVKEEGGFAVEVDGRRLTAPRMARLIDLI